MGFSSPPDHFIFQHQVWEVVKKIPQGKVATYGQIAALVGAPAGVEERSYKALGPRWVGQAMTACPSGVPWQRVINAQGKISLPAHAGGQLQRELLESEGIEFDSRDRVSLTRYGWDGIQVN
jgi:methylated-DNA-protein-cysteine methyltransferase related protein